MNLAIGSAQYMPAWMSASGDANRPTVAVPAQTSLDTISLGHYPEPLGYVATGQGTLVLGSLALGPTVAATALGASLPPEVVLPLMLGSLLVGGVLATAAMRPMFEGAEKTYQATGHGTALAKPYFNEQETVWKPW